MITALLALGCAVGFILVNVVIDRTLGDDDHPGYDVLNVAQDLALRTAGVVARLDALLARGGLYARLYHEQFEAPPEAIAAGTD